MSDYTTELRYICETEAGLTESVGYNNVNEVINNSRTKVFSFDYPIFDNEYKPVLEKKIIKHFYTREIAYETYGRWKLALDAKMNEIMPYYNKLYNSELLEFNPLYDTDLTKDYNRTHDDETKDSGDVTTNLDGTVTTKQTGNVQDYGATHAQDGGIDTANRKGGDHMNRWDKYSDTPQGTVQWVAPQSTQTVVQDGYLTDARNITEDHSGTDITDKTTYGKTTDGTANNTRTYNTVSPTETHSVNKNNLNTKKEFDSVVDYLEHVKGKSPGKSFSKLLMEYRQTFINIDMLIIDELEGLFMQIW